MRAGLILWALSSSLDHQIYFSIAMISTLAVTLVIFVAQGQGRPKYIAIPLEDIEFVKLGTKTQIVDSVGASDGGDLASSNVPLVRHPRGQMDFGDDDESNGDPPSGESRPERQSGGGHHHPYVDYGAHTGHHGAFGWYADFPVHKGS